MGKDEKSLVNSDSMGGMTGLSRLDDVFKEVFDPFWRRFDSLFNSWDLNMETFEKLQPKSSFPKVNVIDNATSYEVEIAIAGFDKDDVELELKDNALLIKADRKEEQSQEDKRYLRREIAQRSFRRCVVFPSEVDAENISAKYNDGIIKCSIGKIEPEQPEKIKISVE